MISLDHTKTRRFVTWKDATVQVGLSGHAPKASEDLTEAFGVWPERPTCTVASFYVTNLLVFVGPEEIMLDQRGRQSSPCARAAESWRRIGSVSQMRQSWPILPHHGHRRRSNAFEKVIAPSHARAAPVPVVQCLVTAPLVKVAGWPHPSLGCGGSTPPALSQC